MIAERERGWREGRKSGRVGSRRRRRRRWKSGVVEEVQPEARSPSLALAPPAERRFLPARGRDEARPGGRDGQRRSAPARLSSGPLRLPHLSASLADSDKHSSRRPSSSTQTVSVPPNSNRPSREASTGDRLGQTSCVPLARLPQLARAPSFRRPADLDRRRRLTQRAQKQRSARFKAVDLHGH
jgi:hypothetical protein